MCQVVDGGDLDIDFQAYDSSLKRIAINRRESYGTHTFTVKESGVYKFCFSNKFRYYIHTVYCTYHT